jgi:hypothetical protein
VLSTWAGLGFGHAEIGCDLGELVEGGLQVLDNLGCQNGGVGQIGGIAQTVVPEPEDSRGALIASARRLPAVAPFTMLTVTRSMP